MKFRKVVLYTAADGRAKWREEDIALPQGTPQAMLSAVFPSVFKPGEHFFSADTLPEGASFDAKVHGHWSAQRGPAPLVTLFVKDSG